MQIQPPKNSSAGINAELVAQLPRSPNPLEALNYVDTMSSQEAIATKQWEEFFKENLRARADFRLFKDATVVQDTRFPLDRQLIVDTLMKSNLFVRTVDPRFTGYVEVLLKTGKIRIENVLNSILAPLEASLSNPNQIISKSGGALEVAVIRVLTDEVSENGNPKTRLASVSIMKALVPWLSMFQRTYDGSNSLAQSLLDIGDALGQFIATFFNSLALRGIMGGNPPKGASPRCVRNWSRHRLTSFHRDQDFLCPLLAAVHKFTFSE